VRNTADGGAGSLRQAILDANAAGGSNTITFAIDSGTQTIRPTSPLPAITGAVTLDGTTQPGFAGTPLIVLDGSGAGAGANGLTLAGGGSTVKGLVIGGFNAYGVLLTGGGNSVTNNYFGTDATGAKALPNATGVAIASSGNTVGGVGPAGNVLCGNSQMGVFIAGGSGNLVQGNSIGVDTSGVKALPNAIGVSVAASGNAVGGPGLGNLISGNTSYGVFVSGTGNTVQGNWAGLDTTAAKALPNGDGVALTNSLNTVGGPAAGAGNIISGNANIGVYVAGGSGNVVQGNAIGTDRAGANAVPNVIGVSVAGSGNAVGGAALGNLISGNTSYGVSLSGSGDTVQGNLVGLDATAANALPNGDGVYVSGPNNLVGGTAAGLGNTVSGNGTGVFLAFGSGNLVQGNRIGTNATGTAAVANDTGVLLTASGNTVGGTTAGAGNTVSGNGTGVLIGSGSGNLLQGNRIGTDASGTAALPNGTGVYVSGTNNTVGGAAPEAGNTISSNGTGVFLAFGGGNVVQGNRIGTDLTAAYPLGNGIGVFLTGSGNTVGGTAAGAGNTISGNVSSGVFLSGGDNVVQGNAIGTDATGTAPLGNGLGVYISGADNTVGGTAAGAGNTLAFNVDDGARVERGSGNAILHNAVFGNGGLGIHLVNGGNHDQPAPTLSSATSGMGLTTVVGTLVAAPSTTFTLELFTSTSGVPGQGQVFLGAMTVTTTSTGLANFSFDILASSTPGDYLTATATDPLGNTSSFSAGVVIG
jgi:parallel beta-helix repeat protein